MAKLEDDFRKPLTPLSPAQQDEIASRMDKLKTGIGGTPDIKQTIEESFNNEEGILEIFKGVYKHAKGGSVPHAQFIMKYWLSEEGEEEIKKFLFSEEVVE